MVAFQHYTFTLPCCGATDPLSRLSDVIHDIAQMRVELEEEMESNLSDR